jgi:hypothetical protein
MLLSSIDKGSVPGIVETGTYIGATRVLYRADIHRKLTLYRNLAYEKTIRVIQRYSRGLCGRRRYREMARVAHLLESSVERRDEKELNEAIAQHFLQKRLGWAGLWTLLPHRCLAKAKVAQKSVIAENAMRAKDKEPASEDHQEALGEWKSMLATMDACQVEDPKSFCADEFIAIRQGKRVINAAAVMMQKLLEAPLLDDHGKAMEEFKTMRFTVESCRVLEPTAFGASAFSGLLAGSRVLASAAAMLDRISSLPVLDDPKAALDEYAKMKAVVDDCILLDPSALSSDNHISLRKGNRVIGGATAAVERLIGKPVHEDFDAAFAEHEEIMSLIKPCIEIDADSFKGETFVALRKGSRVIASATKTVDLLAQKPLLESFEEAIQEFELMMLVIAPCLSMDPASFCTDQYVNLRKGLRVIDEAKQAVRKIASQPLLLSFEASFTEHQSIMAIIDPCLSMDSNHFSEKEFVELRKGSRLVAGMTVTVTKNAELPLLESFEACIKEYETMMKIIEACLLIDPESFHSTEFLALQKYSRVFCSMALRIREICKQPFKETFVDALSEYNEIMNNFIEPALALDAAAFGNEFEGLIQHSRVFESIERQIKNRLELPFELTFIDCMHEYNTMMNDFIKPCLEINAKAFGGTFNDIIQVSS